MEMENAGQEAERLKAKGKKLVFEKNIESNIGVTNFIHPKDMNGILFELFQPAWIYKRKKYGELSVHPTFFSPDADGQMLGPEICKVI
jgi:hypothetical protein